MYTHEVTLRVRYGETDKMGFVYYGVYAQYYEVGRVELLRSLGISYKSIEENGFELPVLNFNINYKKPAYYDDKLTLKTSIKQMPTSKIIFFYECFNDNNQLINNGEISLVFVNKETKKPCRAPEFITRKLSSIL
jgi:acyl-CoA thioester hydrolase